MRIRLIVLLVWVAMLSAVPASATAPGINGRLAWVTGCCDQYELWGTESDLSTLRQLTEPRGLESVHGPSWSPDGRIVFSAQPFMSDYRTSNDLWTIRGDGTGLVRLTATHGWESDPAWSPDGRRIAYARGGDLFVMKAAGYGIRRLTDTRRYEWSPQWSPDGKHLAFLRDVRENSEIFLYDRATGDQTRLTRSEPEEYDEQWLPDGTGLVYTSYLRSDGETQRGIWTIDVTSGAASVVLDQPGIDERTPVVSPDGTRMAWVRVSPHPDPNLFSLSELMISDLDGSNEVVLDTCVLECSFGDLDWEALPTLP